MQGPYIQSKVSRRVSNVHYVLIFQNIIHCDHLLGESNGMEG